MSRFSVDFLCLAVPKNFAAVTFSAVFRKDSGSEKDCGWEGGVSKISVEKFYLTVPKHFVEEPVCSVFQKNAFSEKVFGQEAGRKFQVFPSIFFRPTVPKIRRWTL